MLLAESYFSSSVSDKRVFKQRKSRRAVANLRLGGRGRNEEATVGRSVGQEATEHALNAARDENDFHLPLSFLPSLSTLARSWELDGPPPTEAPR